jgi:glycosyltransferase involved in cell wall biosynthesis
VLLISEFFPHPPERAVFGVYQRLFRTVQAADRFGCLDTVFFWSDNHPVPPGAVAAHQQSMRAAGWPLVGTLDIIPTAAGAQGEWHRYPARALYWMVRGAMSFMQNRPSLRCGGSDQADALRVLLQQRQPDVIIAHRTGVAGTLLRTRLDLPPVVLELEDIDHVKISRLHRTGGAPVSRVRVALWAALAWWSERRAAGLAAATVVCSERDAAALRGPARRARVEVVPNTSFDRTALPPSSAPVALFVGVAYYPPNADAIRWLVREIWPLVRARCPAAELVVVGEGAEAVVEGVVGPGVALVGFAPDLEPHYRRAAVCLCPIRAGSGTRIKIIEAGFCARPVVSTTLGAEGLTFRSGEEMVIADEAGAFADAVADLFADPDRCAALGQAARRRAERDYAPGVLVERMAGIFASVYDAAREESR